MILLQPRSLCLPRAPSTSQSKPLSIPVQRLAKFLWRSSKHCKECNAFYTSERSHKAVCTRKAVSCIYPARKLGDDGFPTVLSRVDGYFKCIRCGKCIKKDQNMKNHARECYGIDKVSILYVSFTTMADRLLGKYG